VVVTEIPASPPDPAGGTSPEHYTPRSTSMFSLVPASYVLLLRPGPNGDEVLLQLRQNTGFMDGHWAAGAAGHVEPGESAEAAARREAREELGLESVELRFDLTLQRSLNPPGGERRLIDERVDFFFSARTWSGEPRITEPDKCADLRWWPLIALPEPVVPHERLVLAHLGTDTRFLTYGL
jgi:8-oxo-dGTP pyrophosphatase MutT (NUDIX family)